jgi:hypothetical protein
MKLRYAILAIMLPTLALVGCSDSSEVLGVDTAAPLAPVIQGAGVRDGMMVVWWSANGEADLDGYNVYATEGGVTSRLNRNLPIDNNRYTAPIDGGSLEVYVTAVDVSGNESSPSVTLSVHADQQDEIADRLPSDRISDGKN